MTFLALWAFAIGAVAATSMVVLHLVARQRPAAYLLPTTRFIPDRRRLVSRTATRPRDLLLLALRVLLLLAVGAAFAQPVLTPNRGVVARVVLLDRSRSVADVAAAVTRARALARDGSLSTVVAFDSVATVLAAPAWDSLVHAPRSDIVGSLSAALIAARRVSVALAETADSVQLIIVSPLAASTFDSATLRMRAEWPGAVNIERVALRRDSSVSWRLEHVLSNEDPLGPAMASTRVTSEGVFIRLVRGGMAPADSVFVRAGGTLVHWDTASAPHPVPEGLAVGDDVIVAVLGRTPLPTTGRVIARWADGRPAATEVPLGAGCIRDVGIALPSAGDIALHPPFQRIARGLLAPCGLRAADRALDSASVRRLVGASLSAAPGGVLRQRDTSSSSLARWLLGFAVVLALAELFVRAKGGLEAA